MIKILKYFLINEEKKKLKTKTKPGMMKTSISINWDELFIVHVTHAHERVCTMWGAEYS